MQGDEIRALRRLQREQEASPYVFTSERGGPMSAKSFGTLFERLGKRAGMPFTIFPHMLRHACGYALANAGHDTRALQAWLGHKNIQHTVRYTGPSLSKIYDAIIHVGAANDVGCAWFCIHDQLRPTWALFFGVSGDLGARLLLAALGKELAAGMIIV
jgi:Phage integrase family